MAALGKIRSKGVVLVCVIGLALFAFIAEELFRSCESSRNESRQQVGVVLGEKISVQDFQQLVDEYQNVLKVQGRDNLTDAEMNQVKDMVWNTYVQTRIISSEAEKLGLTVTDAEMQAVLTAGTNQMLLQTPFLNQQTGRFDVNMLKQFIAEYKNVQTSNPQMAEQYSAIYKYWTFVEKSLKQQMLAQKYQALLASCLLSNPVSAKMAYDAENEESNIQLAALPYSSVKDTDVELTDADVKAKYEELKVSFRQAEETRSIKYVELQVTASAADRKALDKEMAGYVEALREASDPSDIVRKSISLVSYNGLPQTKTAFPSDIAARLDSIAVGEVTAPIENLRDNTLNIIKLVAKTQQPDSVEFRIIQVMADTPELAATKADSIQTALQGGADFETLAKAYSQTGEKAWLTSAQYQSSPSIDADSRAYIETLTSAAVGAVNNVKLSQGNLILQVTDRRNITTKYVAAVVKKTIDFSKDTYSTAYNKFSEFVSSSQNLDDIQKNAAKYGYTVEEYTDVRTADHNVVNISSTREALRWIFDAKEGEVSPLYECGNNDRLLVLVMTKINKKGYRSLDDENVKNFVKMQAMNDKKAEKLLAKVKDCKSVADAKKQGAQVVTVDQVTFASPVFVAATGASEPALSGAVAATAKGKFSAQAVKGNGGVYLFKVTDKTTRTGVKYDAATYEQKQRSRALQAASNFMQDLYLNADVTDNRYLFF